MGPRWQPFTLVWLLQLSRVIKPARNIIVAQFSIIKGVPKGNKSIKVKLHTIFYNSVSNPKCIFCPKIAFLQGAQQGVCFAFQSVFVQNQRHFSLSQDALQRLLKRGIWRVGKHWKQWINYTGNSHVIKYIRVSLLSLTIPKWEHWKKHKMHKEKWTIRKVLFQELLCSL